MYLNTLYKGFQRKSRKVAEFVRKGGDYMENLAKVERTTLTMRETAEYLGISYWLVNQLVRRREIPCARVGGRVLFRVQALDEYLKEKEEKSLKYQERR